MSIRLLVLLLWTLLMASQVQGQELRRLPLTASSSVAADRLYVRILEQFATDPPDQAAESIRQLHAFGAQLVTVDSHHLVEAAYLADHLQSGLDRPREIHHRSTSIKSDSSSLYATRLSGEISSEDLLQLGDREWRVGRIDSARQAWRLAELPHAGRFLPLAETPLQDEFQGQSAARRIIAALIDGRPNLARRQLEQFNNRYPTSAGTLGGKRGPLGDLLRHHVARFTDATRVPTTDSATESLHAPAIPFRFLFRHRSWSRPLGQMLDFEGDVILGMTDQRVIIRQPELLQCLDLITGESIWTLPTAPSMRWSQVLDESQTQLTSPDAVLPETVWLASHRVDDHTPDSQATGDWKLTEIHRETGQSLATFDAQLFSTTQVPHPQLLSGLFDASESSLFLACFDIDSQQLSVSCVDANSRLLQWQTPIGQISATGTLRQTRQLSSGFALSEGLLVCSINGVFACGIEQASGRLLWISGVDSSQPPSGRAPSSVATQFASDMLIEEGVVYLNSQIGPIAVDLYTGCPLWQHFQVPAPTRLVGLKDGQLLVASSHCLTCLNALSGQREWEFASASGSRETACHLVERSALWVTGDELFTVDLETGRLLQRDSLRDIMDDAVRTLAVSSDTLLLQSETQLQAIRLRCTGAARSGSARGDVRTPVSQIDDPVHHD